MIHIRYITKNSQDINYVYLIEAEEPRLRAGKLELYKVDGDKFILNTRSLGLN